MHVTEADSLQTAREKFAGATTDAAIVDFSLPDGDGLELLEHFKSADPDVPVIVLTGQGSIELAVRAIKEGAEQFLTKPVELPVLHTLLLRAVENKRFRQQSWVTQSKARRERLNPFLGTSPAIRKLRELAQRVVSSESPILIQGETGAGKGVLAKWIHNNSPRADEVFMDLNCAGLEREFLETELFGHERGAFTGAVHAKPGLLEVADRGTVFLDEIGDIDLAVQPKLLKVLEAHQFRRLGDVHDRTVDIRLISATHRAAAVSRGPVLSYHHHSDPDSPAARAAGGHSHPGGRHPGAHCGRTWMRRDWTGRNGHSAVVPLSVAGEHPRDAQRTGARRADRAAQHTDGKGFGAAI
jgi:DNA-binding NtrC family response regulator